MHFDLHVFFSPFCSLFSSSNSYAVVYGCCSYNLYISLFSYFLTTPFQTLPLFYQTLEPYDLLIHCPIAYALWNMIFKLFGVMWVMPEGVEDLLNNWNRRLGGPKSYTIQSKIPHCLMWHLWCERNAQTFEGQEKSVPGLKLILLRSLFEWMNASSLFSFDHMFEILDYCPFGA